MPSPLDAKRPISAPLGIGLVLAPEGLGHAVGRLSLRYQADSPDRPARLENPALHALASGNPAGRGLIVLEALARQRPATVVLPYLDASLAVTVTL